MQPAFLEYLLCHLNNAFLVSKRKIASKSDNLQTIEQLWAKESNGNKHHKNANPQNMHHNCFEALALQGLKQPATQIILFISSSSMFHHPHPHLTNSIHPQCGGDDIDNWSAQMAVEPQFICHRYFYLHSSFLQRLANSFSSSSVFPLSGKSLIVQQSSKIRNFAILISSRIFKTLGQ